MAVKHKVTVSVQPTNRQPSSAERRAAQVASISTKQAELKQEFLARRAEREHRDQSEQLLTENEGILSAGDL